MILKLCSRQSHKIDLLYLIVATGIITTQLKKVGPMNQWPNEQSVLLFSVVCDKRIKKSFQLAAMPSFYQSMFEGARYLVEESLKVFLAELSTLK